jgi:hypothetical protein
MAALRYQILRLMLSRPIQMVHFQKGEQERQAAGTQTRIESQMLRCSPQPTQLQHSQPEWRAMPRRFGWSAKSRTD